MLQYMNLKHTCRDLDTVLYWRDQRKGLYLDPPYQRGNVWGWRRRRNLIRSIILGVPIASIIINDRMWAEWADDERIAVIDGKQRITTLLAFFDGNFYVPGEWFGDSRAMVSFSDLEPRTQRRFRSRQLALCESRLPTLEAEREVFNLVNYGGLAQGERDEDSR